jgi:hypothetical protein
LAHAEEVYKVQMTYDEFRMAPFEFKKEIIASYATLVIKGCNIKRGMNAADIQSQYFDAFNRGTGKELKVTVTYKKENFNSVKIEINGRTYYVNLNKLIKKGLVQR